MPRLVILYQTDVLALFLTLVYTLSASLGSDSLMPVLFDWLAAGPVQNSQSPWQDWFFLGFPFRAFQFPPRRNCFGLDLKRLRGLALLLSNDPSYFSYPRVKTGCFGARSVKTSGDLTISPIHINLLITPHEYFLAGFTSTFLSYSVKFRSETHRTTFTRHN